MKSSNNHQQACRCMHICQIRGKKKYYMLLGHQFSLPFLLPGMKHTGCNPISSSFHNNSNFGNFMTIKKFCVRVSFLLDYIKQVEKIYQGKSVIAINDIIEQLSPDRHCSLYRDDFMIFVWQEQNIPAKSSKPFNKLVEWAKYKIYRIFFLYMYIYIWGGGMKFEKW